MAEGANGSEGTLDPPPTLLLVIRSSWQVVVDF